MTTKRVYIKPDTTLRVDRVSKLGRKLYPLEERRYDALKACAQVWLEIAERPQTDFWTWALPQVLYDTLESVDTEAARIAAITYLEKQGYTVVTAPEKGL